MTQGFSTAYTKLNFSAPKMRDSRKTAFSTGKRRVAGRGATNCRLKRRALGNWDCYNYCCQTPERDQVSDCCICSE